MRFIAASLMAAGIVAVTTPAARADGDPASDYLLGQDNFLPFDAKIPAAKAKQLTDLLTNAARAGFKIKVAVIKTRYDLGSITVLYDKPQKYAEFLGAEIFFAYRGRLLVVMPNGYGYSVGGKRPPRRALHPLAGLAPPGPSSTQLVSTALTAVRRLAAGEGVRLDIPQAHRGGQRNRDRIIIIAIALTLAALIGSWMLVRRLRAARRT